VEPLILNFLSEDGIQKNIQDMDALQEHKVPSLHLTPGRDSLNTGDREKRIKNDKSTTIFSTWGKNSLESYTGSQAMPRSLAKSYVHS